MQKRTHLRIRSKAKLLLAGICIFLANASTTFAPDRMRAPTLTIANPALETDSTEEVFILEDYDGNGVVGSDRGLFGKGKTALVSKIPGNTARQLVDDANYFGLIQIRDFRVAQDISGYDHLEFSYYSDAADKKRTIQLQLSFANPLEPSAENLWNWQIPAALSVAHKQWIKASIDLKEANFKRASPTVRGNEFDLTCLDRIAILILRNGARKAASPVYVDNIIASRSGIRTNFLSAAPEPPAQMHEEISPASADDVATVRTSRASSTSPMTAPPSAATDTTTEVFVMEDYDGNGINGEDNGLFGEGTTALVNKTPGNTVRELVDDAHNFGLIQIRDFSVEQDISEYDRLEFSYYSEAVDSRRTIQLQLSFGNQMDPSAENLWNWQIPAALSVAHKQWIKASIDLKEADFERASSWVKGNKFDLTRLNRIAILILRNGANEAASPVYVDNIIAFKSDKSEENHSAASEPPVQVREAAVTASAENTPTTPPKAKLTQNRKTESKMPTSPTTKILVLEDYDGGGVDGDDNGLFGEGTTALINKTPGNTVRELVDDAHNFGLIQIRDFSVEQDISKYDHLEFSYYSEAADNQRTIQLQLSFTNTLDPSAENLWNWRVPVALATGYNQWTKARIDLKEMHFERACPWARGNHFDLTQLNRIAILILRNGASEAASPVYVDNIIASKSDKSTETLSSASEPPVQVHEEVSTASVKNTPTVKSTQNRTTTPERATSPTPEILTLEDYDGGGVDGSDKGLFGKGITTLISKTPGNTVRELVDDTNHFGLIQIKDLTVEQDISGYDCLVFSYYSEAADNQRTIQLQLSFTNTLDPSAENLWNWRVPTVLAAGHKKWTKASIGLKEANFKRASPIKRGNDFDLTRLNRIAILILSNRASEAASPVYIDNIAVTKHSQQ